MLTAVSFALNSIDSTNAVLGAKGTYLIWEQAFAHRGVSIWGRVLQPTVFPAKQEAGTET